MINRYCGRLLLLFIFAIAVAQRHVNAQHNVAEVDYRPARAMRGYSIQVAAFETQVAAEKQAAALDAAGEIPMWGSANIPGLGRWIRVFVGSFGNQTAARRYAQSLVKKGVITDFIVKPAVEIESLERPRTVARVEIAASHGGSPGNLSRHTSSTQPEPAFAAHSEQPRPLPTVRKADAKRAATPASLPAASEFDFRRLPPVEIGLLPRGGPIRLALQDVLGVAQPASGGLWVTGDAEEALERLRWMAGDDNASLVSLGADGKVRLHLEPLLDKACPSCVDVSGAALLLANAISTNEGLLLLAQLTLGPDRYQLHIGPSVNINGSIVPVYGSINLDNKYDRRINPGRQDGKKLPWERPAAGVDSLVVINPAARWLNLDTNRLVSTGAIAFHELAEAYAKVHLNVEYLESEGQPGAHDLAVARELKLLSERTASEVVVSAGLNRVFKSEREAHQFTSRAHGRRAAIN